MLLPIAGQKRDLYRALRHNQFTSKTAWQDAEAAMWTMPRSWSCSSAASPR
ncbi:hypothetical protein [Acidisphaera rubrifaciens]|nr:hypothetical protein [Acidisphaera rubrifaciens]